VSLYRRGKIWWYEFEFFGVRIRESSKSRQKSVAERRRALEMGASGLKDTKQPVLFSVAAKKWLETNKPHWSASNLRIESYHVDHLLPNFGKMFLSDISADDISRFQAKRKKEHASPRTINMQVGTLRAILRKHRLWANLQPDVRMLKARHDIGRALTEDEQLRLLAACKKSRSRSLYPAIQLSLHTGLRNQELRLLRWRQIDLIDQTVTVGKSKTEGGQGRLVPLSQTAFRCLQEWRSLFPNAQPAHYVFPSEIWAGSRAEVRPNVPIGSWKTAWTVARKAAGVDCRWHDMRHTFVSRMAEGQASDATIMSLAGHLSRKMMELYSHTRNEAKRQAISVLDTPARPESPQNPPQ